MITADPDTAGSSPPNGTVPPRRVLHRRTRLPAGRAIVGGLLVAVAAVASIAAAQSNNGPDTVAVVVAAETIEPGTALGPDTLKVVDMALPDELSASTYDDPTTLDGTVARSRLDPGELLQRGDVIESTSAQRAVAPAREIALRLDADRVVAGRLESGDRVDVLATYGTGVDAFTLVVLRDARVMHVETNDDSIRSADSVVLTLALDDRADTVALAHAVDVAAINVVRTTTADADPEAPAPYRPQPSAEEDGGR